ncbi:MAG: hypothetical protein ACE5FD_07255, partial [Anaerolineae bacterium]
MGKRTGLWNKIVLLVVIAIFLSGCGQTTAVPTPTREVETGSNASPTAVPPPTQEITGSNANPTAVPSDTAVPPTPILPSAPAQLIQPPDLSYLGAFRLPEGSGGSSWEYSGYAMAFYPGGDPDGPDDGFPG